MELSFRVDGAESAPLLVLGPSLGTTTEVWSPQLDGLAERWRVLRYDLPGHGASAPAEGFGVGELAEAVVRLAGDGRFAIGGVSLGGAVAATVAARCPERVDALVLSCTSARFGEPGPWLERAAAVRAEGTGTLREGAAQRWFTPDAPPATAKRFVDGLADVDDASYAACCEALAAFDLRDELPAITAPTLVIAGAADPATPPDHALALATGIPDATLRVVPAAHLANVEQPVPVTEAIAAHLTRPARAGERTRRAVLGDAHVDRAQAATTRFTADFQDFITRYAWDGIWNRPGLDRRTRSCITLTALVTGGHLAELALHVRAALRNGLTPDEIKEVLLQTAVYCGVPAANAAFAVAAETLAAEGVTFPAGAEPGRA